MRRAGEVVGTAQGVAVCRTPRVEEDTDPPAIGTTVVDESLEELGRVVDVFGPVDRPYLAVSPDEGVDPATLIGRRVYSRE